mmetsp:Transcript_25120/g.46257  ORF Transcript_25120/g.46257 Transcript_25120/m.46257 type:complete len:567 (+) Transcript_25120:60-1760(+)
MCKGAAIVAVSRAHQMEPAEATVQRLSAEGMVPPAALLPPEPLKPPRTLQWHLEVSLDSLSWMPRPSPASPVNQGRPPRSAASSSTAPAGTPVYSRQHTPGDISDTLSRSTETIVVTSRTLQRLPSDTMTIQGSRSTSAVMPSDALGSSTKAIVATTSALQEVKRLGLPASLAWFSQADQANQATLQGFTRDDVLQPDRQDYGGDDDLLPERLLPPAPQRWRLVSGAYSIMGKKHNFPGFPNQDRFVVVPISEHRTFAAVMDGHGWKGHAVARATAQLFEAHAPSVGVLPAAQLPPALSSLFHQAHNMLVQDGLASMSGTTATVALIDTAAATVTTAHVGDSRIIVCADAELCFATRDHVIDADAERHIRSCGGEVRAAAYNGVAARRVFMPGAELPGLGMSRALGDQEAHTLGVTCEPELHVVPFEPASGGIVIASDGLWDKFSPQMVAERLVTAEGFGADERDRDPYVKARQRAFDPGSDVKSELELLRLQKRQAVESEDFSRASELRRLELELEESFSTGNVEDQLLQDFTQLLVQEGRSRWSDEGDIDDVTAVVIKAVPASM